MSMSFPTYARLPDGRRIFVGTCVGLIPSIFGDAKGLCLAAGCTGVSGAALQGVRTIMVDCETGPTK